MCINSTFVWLAQFSEAQNFNAKFFDVYSYPWTSNTESSPLPLWHRMILLLHKMGHVLSFLGLYICMDVKYKGNVFKLKCCLIIMRCLCQIAPVAVILFLSFVSLFQIELTENEYSSSPLPCLMVKYSSCMSECSLELPPPPPILWSAELSVMIFKCYYHQHVNMVLFSLKKILGTDVATRGERAIQQP